MSEAISLTSHIEALVDSSRPSSQHAASVNAIASLVKNDLLTLEVLVKELELYLTTMDHVIRGRGILLLAEILTCLVSKSLGSTIISTLVGFFTSRLEDWRALRGALVGCLALLRRNINAGMIVSSDALTLAQSFLTNIHVQSLAVQDRKLSYEVLQHLLNVFPTAVVTLIIFDCFSAHYTRLLPFGWWEGFGSLVTIHGEGEYLVYQICEAIDKEKDPRCLILTFHLVEMLAQLFPDPSGPVASYAEELFEILGCYFPIDFTHPSDDFEIKREDLSDALMKAFSSTPFFEPFSVPLLLDKLSSSLHLAKLDSLRYLNSCITCYGAGRMLKHANTIWIALKNVIFHHLPQGPMFSLESERAISTESQEAQIAKEALICLQTAICQLNYPNNDTFLTLMLDDDNLEMHFVSASSERFDSSISEGSQHQLKSFESIISVSSRISHSCCSKVFQKFFRRLMDTLGVSTSNSSNACFMSCEISSKTLHFGALYLCVELLASCRELSVGPMGLPQQLMVLQDSWWYQLRSFSYPLAHALESVMVTLSRADQNANIKYSYYTVKGLQILATFPGYNSPIQEDVNENILKTLLSIVINNPKSTFLWKASLKALVQIGSSIVKFQDTRREMSYSKIVVETIVSLLSLDDSSMSLAQKLEASCEVGMAGQNFMAAVISGFEEAIFSSFRKTCVEGNIRAAETLVPLLECYSNQILSWCSKSGRIEEVALSFAVKIWDYIGNTFIYDADKRPGLLDSTVKAMKLVVSNCTRENQSFILQKAYNIISSTTISSVIKSMPLLSSKLYDPLLALDIPDLSCRDEWIISLFTSVVIALHPETPLPEAKRLLELFMVLLLKGYVNGAHAMASVINKWPTKINEIELPCALSLQEASDMIFDTLSSALCGSTLREFNFIDNMEMTSGNACPSYLQVHAVTGLAWVGKGLLMRGHEKVKEITLLFMSSFLVNQKKVHPPLDNDESENTSMQDMHSSVARSIADAFHILLSDSEFCLRKEFHAMIRPLYKQRFFSTVIPIFLSQIKEPDSSGSRGILYRAFGHVISNTSITAVVAEAKKVILPLLDALSGLSPDILNKDLVYSMLLVLAGIVMDENGKEVIIENTHVITRCLTGLISYPHMTLVRETAIQCLVAMTGLPHTKIYPLRLQVLRAVSKALDDRKRAVRQEAAKCRQAWASIATRSLQF